MQAFFPAMVCSWNHKFSLCCKFRHDSKSFLNNYMNLTLVISKNSLLYMIYIPFLYPLRIILLLVSCNKYIHMHRGPGLLHFTVFCPCWFVSSKLLGLFLTLTFCLKWAMAWKEKNSVYLILAHIKYEPSTLTLTSLSCLIWYNKKGSFISLTIKWNAGKLK